MTPAVFLLCLLISNPALPDSADAVDRHVVRLATSDLARRFPSDAHRLAVQVRRLSTEAGLDAETVFWPDATNLPEGLTRVDLVSGGRKSGWAMLYIAQFDSVLVTARPIAKGEAVTRADVSVRWIETTRVQGTFAGPGLIPPEAELWSTRYLSAERILRPTDLRAAYAVHVGDPVEMDYQRGAFSFRLRCTSRDDAAVGEAVRLVSNDTGATYRARVTADARATWISTLSNGSSKNR